MGPDHILVEGGALMGVRLQGTLSYDPETGEMTYDVVAGEKLPGVGVCARLPFRVFLNEDPP
jgi:hypothetical protein